ncbi:ABC transporter ATP-binding protein [Austwickia chelonae]|uniref:ABC transporter ATP-binding protein n=1 Tax=Austwickia chelonae TaxID=100225 RepID=UPI000E243860|nr:ABC transporter ATP-binding protein [Austwickia chelonae]
MTGVIHCERVTKVFGSFQAVQDLDLVAEPGEVIGYLGPNGAGKSTTIRMLMGLTRPTGGTVHLLGQNPAEVPAVRAQVGYCPGELRLDDRLTIRETLETWSMLRGGVDRALMTDLIERFDIDPGKVVHSLSTGNRRKVGLVGAFMVRPDVLILDEPTNGLDPLMQRAFVETLGEAVWEGATVLLSSHVLSEVERLATRLVILRQGKVVAEGSVASFRDQAQQIVESVVGRAPDIAELNSLAGASDVEIDGDMLRLAWRGPMDGLIQVLSRCQVQKMRIHEPDLERSFMDYYRNDSNDGGGK